MVLEGNANFHLLVFGEVPLRKEYLRQIYTQRAPRVQRLFKVNWIMRKPFLLYFKLGLLQLESETNKINEILKFRFQIS